MNAETDAYFGRDKPSRTYKWGLVLPSIQFGEAYPWRVVCWFKTRKAAEDYAKRVHGRNPYAIARANL